MRGDAGLARTSLQSFTRPCAEKIEATVQAMFCDCCGSARWTPLFSDHGFQLGRCTDCALHYIDPMPAATTRMTEMERGHFAGEQKVLSADRQLASEQVQRRRFSSYVDAVKQHKPDGLWLDIGCGSGTLLTLAHGAGYSIEGIELSADRRSVAGEVTRAKIHDRPVEDLAFPDATFDVISLINVFSHLTAPRQTLAELARILKPSGVAVVATGELDVGIAESHVFRWNLGDHLFFLGKGTMLRYAQRTGLRIASQNVTWTPSLIYTRDRFSVMGMSGVRNTIKRATLAMPGAMPLISRVMLRREAGNAAYSAVYVLQKS